MKLTQQEFETLQGIERLFNYDPACSYCGLDRYEADNPLYISDVNHEVVCELCLKVEKLSGFTNIK